MSCQSHPPWCDHHSTSYENSHAVFFSRSLPPSQVQIFSLSPCSQTPSFYVLPLIWGSTFHNITEQIKLYFFIYEGRLQISWTHLIIPIRNFVEVWWRSLFRSTSLDKRCTSYNAPPTSRNRAADRLSLRNFLPWISLFMAWKAQKSHRARSELYGGCSNGVPPVQFFQAEHRTQFRCLPMRFLDFSNHEKGPRQEISKWPTVCSTFSRSGWSVVRSASLVKGSTSKKRPSPHLHKVPTRSNKLSPRTLQTTLVV
jgi:hypothetical protein